MSEMKPVQEQTALKPSLCLQVGLSAEGEANTPGVHVLQTFPSLGGAPKELSPELVACPKPLARKPAPHQVLQAACASRSGPSKV